MTEELTAVQKFIDTVIEYCVQYGFQVIGAIIILLVGFFVAKVMCDVLRKFMESKKVDVILTQFTVATVRLLILGFVILIALGKFGITIAPFIAMLGALAFGASFAIQGPLSNYGAGISLILTRPFTVGDTITVAGVSGVVQEVKLACTILTDAEGEKITIPNKHIVGEILQNSRENKLVPGVIGISYGADPEKAIAIIKKILSENKDIYAEKEPVVGIQGFGDSSVDISFRYYVPTVKYFPTIGSINLAIFKAFNKEGIEIPFPQRDVHIINEK